MGEIQTGPIIQKVNQWVPSAWEAVKDDAHAFATGLMNTITMGGLPGHEDDQTKSMEMLLQHPKEVGPSIAANLLTNVPMDKVKQALQNKDYAAATAHVLLGLATKALGGEEMPEELPEWSEVSDLEPGNAGKWANFLNQKKDVTFKHYRALVPETKPVGYVPSMVDKLTALTAPKDPAVIDQVKDIAQAYRKNDDFKKVADSARHYVHNSDPVTNASRMLLGMDPLIPPYKDIEQLVDSLGKDQFGNMHIIPGLSSILKDETTGKQQFPAWYVTKAPGDEGVQYLNGSYDSRAVMPLAEAKVHAARLMQAVREAKESDNTLYRGMALPQPLHAEWSNFKPGDEIDLPLSSFSTDPATMENFASKPGKSPVNLILEGPHKSIQVAPLNHFEEQEHLTHGNFVVTKVVKPDPVIKARLEELAKQTVKVSNDYNSGVLKWDDYSKNMNELNKEIDVLARKNRNPLTVHIRQGGTF